MSESRLKQANSTVRLSAVVTTLADSQHGMQTSGLSRDSRAGIEIGPRLRGDMIAYVSYFRDIES